MIKLVMVTEAKIHRHKPKFREVPSKPVSIPKAFTDEIQAVTEGLLILGGVIIVPESRKAPTLVEIKYLDPEIDKIATQETPTRANTDRLVNVIFTRQASQIPNLDDFSLPKISADTRLTIVRRGAGRYLVKGADQYFMENNDNRFPTLHLENALNSYARNLRRKLNMNDNYLENIDLIHQVFDSHIR